MAMRHLIVGAGPAAQNAIETLRALDAKATIQLVCDEPAYARMVLPYYLMGNVDEAALRTGDDGWWDELRVDAHIGRRVESLDAGTDCVRLDDGSELEFDRLLIATGSSATRPRVPGADGSGVVDLWTLADANEFLAAPHGDVVIVGAGFIAFTILDAVAKRARRVHFVEMEPHLLPRMLTGARLERVESSGGRRHLTLSDGRSLDCDLVLMATGVRPNTGFLAGSGIELDHGVLVDDHLRTSRPGVFAAGDVAQGPDLLGGPRRVQAIQPVAVDHGRVAGANMAGNDVAYSGSLTMNILDALGLEAASLGRWEGRDDTVVVANAANHVYRKYVFEEDRLVGGILVGPTVAVTGMNDVGMLKGLIQTGVRLGAWKSYLAKNPLDLRRAFVASGAAKELLGSALLAGRATGGGGFRFPPTPARRSRSRHHATLLSGSRS
jgi:NAD(P)H-nitrite reductase large subunit